MKPIAPFKLAPYFQPRIWGYQDLAPWFEYETTGEPIGEVWLTGEQCAAATGPLAGLSVAELIAQHGEALLGPAGQRHETAPAVRDFPLLLKVIFPRDKLSVQVHPDDRMAQKYGMARGKTECWYTLEAEPDAKVALGLVPGTGPEQIRAAIDDGTLEDLLNQVPVKAGDLIFVDAGTVHAIWPGAVLFEVQQQSDTTYRLYDYGRPRELHIDKALEAMKLETAAAKVAPERRDGCTVLIDGRYFRVERWGVANDPHARELAGTPDHTVSLLFVSEGAVTITGDSFEPFKVRRCEVAVIPAKAPNWLLRGSAGAELLRVIPKFA